jgi:uncharacterized protein
MVWIRRFGRRYDPRYDPRYDGYGYPRYGPRRYYGPNNSCLRDACLLETGCCLAEGLGGNCLVTGMLLLPQFVGALIGGGGEAARSPRRRAAAGLVRAIRVYQSQISAHRAPCCRFSPSCSHYAVEAIERHGALRGTCLAGRRLLRCRPGGARGSDPLPA